jgi:hypothetical protein
MGSYRELSGPKHKFPALVPPALTFSEANELASLVLFCSQLLLLAALTKTSI